MLATELVDHVMAFVRGDRYVLAGVPSATDLNPGGARICYYITRLLALREGIAARSTAGRLRALVEQETCTGQDLRARVRAVFFVLRPTAQVQRRGNGIDPASPSGPERAALQLALTQAHRPPDRVRVDRRWS